MEEIRIYCENTGTYEHVPLGSTLKQLSDRICPTIDAKCGCGMSVLAALVDRKLVSLDYKVINPHNVQFVGYEHPDGRRTYIRSLCFVLQNVVREMYPEKVLAIDYSLPSGLYCEIRENTSQEDGRPKVYFVTDEEIAAQEQSNVKTIVQDSPISKALTTILSYAAKAKASDIHIEPLENSLIIRCRIDGVLRRIMELPKTVAPALVSRIKILSNLKIDEHRIPQDGQFTVVVDIPHCLLQDEGYCTLIYSVTFEVGDIYILKRKGLIDFVVKLLDAVVDKCGQHGIFAIEIGLGE